MTGWKPEAGTGLQSIRCDPLTHRDLAAYSLASGDHNPLHSDREVARKIIGQDDVIGHGMYSMAIAARLLTGVVRPEAIHQLSVRFRAMTHIGDILVASGTVREIEQGANRRLALVDVRLVTSDDRLILTGEAVIDL